MGLSFFTCKMEMRARLYLLCLPHMKAYEDGKRYESKSKALCNVTATAHQASAAELSQAHLSSLSRRSSSSTILASSCTTSPSLLDL